jgi:LytS/YehU family sensor histidine kinase
MLAAKDSLFSQEKVKYIQNLTFNEEQRQQEMKAQQEAFQNQLKLYGLLTLGIVSSIIAFILWRNNQHKQKAYALLQQQKEETEQQKAKAEQTLEELKATQDQLVEQEKAALENELKLERAAYQSKAIELEMQALRAQMNPHFIFNCLNSINRFILKNESEAASDYLTKFSKLIRLILQNSQAKTVTLANELEALGLYLEMEMLRFEDQFDYQITCHPQLEAEDLEVPPLLIQPYVENAIWHGLMHKEGKGHISIYLQGTEQMLICSIEDDGIGRKRAGELKSKSATKKKSLGMQITSHRLQLLRELYGRQPTVVVEDLVDAIGEACGTRVVVEIPVSRE